MNSRLEFEMSGSEIDYVVTNTIRRIIISEIPIMVFDEIDITENTSVFNNNQLRLYIRNIPVVGVKNIPLSYRKKKDKVDEAEEEEDEDLDDLIGGEAEIVEQKEKVESSSLENLTMYLEYVNESSEIKSVTTEDAKFYYMGGEIKNPYPNPVILVKLQPKQKIKLSAKTRLSVEKEDGKHSHTAICAYNELDKNKFKFFLESRGQLEEKELLVRACEVINKKLKKCLRFFQK
jgi:DNA-directed RNA polymerase alpha subunit